MNIALIAALLGQVQVVAGGAFAPGDKPSGLMPEHKRVSVGELGKLDVVDVAAWEKMFAAEPKTQRGCVTDPVASLKAALASKRLPPPDREFVIPGCPDASSPFTLHVRRVRVGRFDGFLFVTQWFIEAVLTNNRELEATFHGLTADGKTYAVATFRVRAKGLRDEPTELQKDTAVYRKALEADARFLAALKPTDFEPSLDAIADALRGARVP